MGYDGPVSRRFLLLAALAAPAGCNALWGLNELGFGAATTDGAGGGGGGDGGEANGGNGPGGSGAGGTGAGGGAAGCETDVDCFDGDPCTINICNASGQCAESLVSVGAPGTGEGLCEGTCQTDGGCGLSLYRRKWPDGADDRPFVKTPLSISWTGANAPPPRGILAADSQRDGLRLVVFTDANGGTAHIRNGESWVSGPTSELFPGLPGAAVNTAVFYQSEADGPHTLGVSVRGAGTTKLAYYFTLSSTDEITADAGNPYTIMAAGDPDAAAQESTDCDWELSVQKAFLGTPSWVVFWRSYEADIYSVDGGDFTWNSFGPDVSSPLWGSNDSGPASGTTRAAFTLFDELVLIAP